MNYWIEIFWLWSIHLYQKKFFKPNGTTVLRDAGPYIFGGTFPHITQCSSKMKYILFQLIRQRIDHIPTVTILVCLKATFQCVSSSFPSIFKLFQFAFLKYFWLVSIKCIICRNCGFVLWWMLFFVCHLINHINWMELTKRTIRMRVVEMKMSGWEPFCWHSINYNIECEERIQSGCSSNNLVFPARSMLAVQSQSVIE